MLGMNCSAMKMLVSYLTQLNAQQISYVSGRCVIIPFHYYMSDSLQKKEHIFPLLFHVAMDVLPAQASSVPSERICSSSKETCTLCRNRISPTMLEALQILKFIYKQERLNFTVDLVAYEWDYVISDCDAES